MARPSRPLPQRKAPRPGAAATGRGAPVPEPLGEHDIDALQRLLDAVPAPLEALDVSMLDGFLCAVLVQPRAVPASRWLAHVGDVDGRPLPAGFDPGPLHRLVLRRHAELGAAIAARRWFDPWVFELAPEAGAPQGAAAVARDAVLPWVAGFATGFELFPALSQAAGDALLEPLALLYRHLDANDLEDADALRAEIDAGEPPQDLAEAVEQLVRATLLLADEAAAVDPPRRRGG